MAREWIKFEINTPDKVEVLEITAAMGWDDPDLTVGKLLRVWRWFDQQTLDGEAPGVTLALLDRVVGVNGFAQAMIGAGWLEQYEGGLRLPRFGAHNGETAKKRALNAVSNANKRLRDAAGITLGITAAITPPSPRKEKKKEKTTTTAFDARAELARLGVSAELADEWLGMRAKMRAPVTRSALARFVLEAGKAGMTLPAVLKLCCEKTWRGFEASWAAQEMPRVQVKDWE